MFNMVGFNVYLIVKNKITNQVFIIC
ncbi:hypothetical protein [[Enterobacter] lignolyticus]